MTDPEKVDARGVPIQIGSRCIYGAPVGRSIALVEAELIGWTPSGRVNVRVIRRAYGHSGRDVVHVGADRLIQINDDTLPPTDLPDEAEKARLSALMYSHSWQWERTGPNASVRTCTRCNLRISTPGEKTEVVQCPFSPAKP